jgi:hypothetical protein
MQGSPTTSLLVALALVASNDPQYQDRITTTANAVMMGAMRVQARTAYVAAYKGAAGAASKSFAVIPRVQMGWPQPGLTRHQHPAA